MSCHRQHLVWDMKGTSNDCGPTQSCRSECWSCYLRPIRKASNYGESLYGRMLYSSMKMKFHLEGYCMYHLQCLGTECDQPVISNYHFLSLPTYSTYPTLSYPILSYLILFYPIRYDPIRSDPIRSDLILSYPILSYPILSYPILSYPILSYPFRQLSLSYVLPYSALAHPNISICYLTLF